jgi:hypothetical protein
VVDKSKRGDGTFSREDFSFDKEQNVYICPAGKVLTMTGKLFNDGETLYYRAKTRDCRSCLLKAQCCPKAPLYEEARDVARVLAKTEAFQLDRGLACGDRRWRPEEAPIEPTGSGALVRFRDHARRMLCG